MGKVTGGPLHVSIGESSMEHGNGGRFLIRCEEALGLVRDGSF